MEGSGAPGWYPALTGWSIRTLTADPSTLTAIPSIHNGGGSSVGWLVGGSDSFSDQIDSFSDQIVLYVL